MLRSGASLERRGRDDRLRRQLVTEGCVEKSWLLVVVKGRIARSYRLIAVKGRIERSYRQVILKSYLENR